jgi:4-amino-4-deoxy-L-arabinose transferase-like glycosyltransferase
MDHGVTTHQAADAEAIGSPPATSRRGSRRRERARWLDKVGAWPLFIVLACQTALSLRLLHADSAFQDEAAYLWAGHLELAHLLHGAPVPPLSAYFSGAPVIYPPLGAIADGIGGLADARILSLAFLLGATALLWSVASQLYGRRAALFAAALFAAVGPTLHLGTFATYDSMAMFLLALAAWCMVSAGRRPTATGWMIAGGVALALANATAYWTGLFDPVVILLAFLITPPQVGWKEAGKRSLVSLTVVLVLVAGGLLIGGSSYITGIEHTTLLRVGGTDSAVTILAHAFAWTGVVAVIALAGTVIGWVEQPRGARAWLLTLLTAAALLVPLEQASIQTIASLNKHVVAGAWFAAIAAGYAIDRFIASAVPGRMMAITYAACVLALVFPMDIAAHQSLALGTAWPNSSSFLAIIRPAIQHTGGRLLVEDPSVAEYYLPAGSQWKRWSSTRNIVLPSGASTGGPSTAAGVTGAGNAGVYAVFIQEGYFSLVALNFSDTTALDHRINADLLQNHHYHIIDVLPYGPGPLGPTPGTYVIWRYEQRG